MRDRRSFLTGFGALLIAAPAIVRASVKRLLPCEYPFVNFLEFGDNWLDPNRTYWVEEENESWEGLPGQEFNYQHSRKLIRLAVD